MANFSVPAPVEPEKSAFLHDRTNRPAGPVASRMDMAKQWAGLAVGLVLAVGLTALLFSIRDSWENHREWLVTVIPMLVIAGIALAHLSVRKQMVALAPGLLFLFLALVFAGADLVLDREDGSMTQRDVLSILAGIALGIGTAYLIVALLWLEIRKPTKAPTPEL